MEPEQVTCHFCGEQARRVAAPKAHQCHQYTGCACKGYYVWSHDLATCLDGRDAYDRETKMRIAMLLQEMSVKQRCNKDAGGKPRVLPVLQFSRGDYGEIAGAVPLAVEDLLATWPRTVPEKIERGLCNLINSVRHSTVPGTDISLDQHVNRPFLFFADNRQTFDYFVNAMVDYHWLKQHYAANGLVSGCRQVCVTPEGWRKYDELTRTEGSAKNPVFVAMWFGGDKQQKEMLSLFEGALEPAINDAGYHAKRADTDEHNEQIIDRIVTDIRRAPFVVAELTDNNPGVYYEAGLAQGQNKTVIYCAPRGHEEAHFDVRGVSQVRWSNPENLHRRLTDRILATMKEGLYYKDPEDGSRVRS